jgi:hypothetical protein
LENQDKMLNDLADVKAKLFDKTEECSKLAEKINYLQLENTSLRAGQKNVEFKQEPQSNQKSVIIVETPDDASLIASKNCHHLHQTIRRGTKWT